jgi:serine/threonine protein kinase
MTCPRCGNEWDVTKSPCSNCGLTVRLPNSMRSASRTPTPNLQPLSSIKRPVPGMSPITPPVAPVENLSAEGQSTGALGTSFSQDFSTPRTPTTTGNMESKLPQSGALNRSQSEPLSQKPFARGGEPQRNVPPRPQSMTPVPQTRNVMSEAGQPSLRAKRLVTNADKEEAQTAQVFKPESGATSFASSAGMSGATSGTQLPMLLPGTILRNNRYQLREMLNRQEWQEGVYEATWYALDGQRGGAVIITELVLPESNSMAMQSILRTATMVLTSVGRHPYIPTLWDAFSDQGRNFFVFEPPEGESLSMRMRRTGRALSEQEIIECALQVIDVLELLSQQLPPLVHGLIRPENVIISRDKNQYELMNFSIILAGGATQFISNLERTRLSAYMSPEFARGMVDTRADLYSLIATLYHAATGSVPSLASAIGMVPGAQRLNPLVSAQLETILSKGLRPIIAQRYQRPAELRQELLAIQTVGGSAVQKSSSMSAGELSFAQLVQAQYSSSSVDSAAKMLPGLLSSDLGGNEPERKLLLPRPEDLPPMIESNDTRLSIYWLVGILICLSIVVIASRMLV